MLSPNPKSEILSELHDRINSLAILGLNPSGLALALAFGRKVPVTAFDPDPVKVMLLRQGSDPSGEFPPQAFQGVSVDFTCYPDVLARCRAYIVAVPALPDAYGVPATNQLITASESIGRGLKRGDLVIYETMIYPGGTEEVCVPVLERVSGLKAGIDFHYGFCPTRYNPGDTQHRPDNTVRVVSGCNELSQGLITSLFRLVTKAGLYPVSSIRTAEMVKLMENSQRDVNRALANEWAMICNLLNINTFEALEAAGSKWNFQPFVPGLPGGPSANAATGHLLRQSGRAGFVPPVLSAVNQTDTALIPHIASRVVKLLAAAGTAPQMARVLILGITAKENVSDITRSRIPELIGLLRTYGIESVVADPRADAKEAKKTYSLDIKALPDFTIWEQEQYDGVILAVAHDEFQALKEINFRQILKPGGFLFDLKGVFRKRVQTLVYVTL
ncbi:MAG: nucleotide sugar dehydrogenase [Bacteroidales bacterium]|jgi:UDP-N-acetyl-D-galactosamine dehydrogenase|nr:nucleotide sugar dehydrogenase [Bacteroidales bacterium]MDD2571278.1 nucleotide sugar dehydrogenase [Bacteroidales bacterium]MDD2812277.1 nucleotide sugar dehydrogenase [Bacteroidales bacterium]MDD3385650.1 nucleotide sugar dehydrogenase [Bacteroidales bacterium]MDD4813470.1 nucleotide sugar dehydrogenase [Bacteroidales bacterium]